MSQTSPVASSFDDDDAMSETSLPGSPQKGSEKKGKPYGQVKTLQEMRWSARASVALIGKEANTPGAKE